MWDDLRLQAGDRWREEIELSISRARVAVLLISADFMASDFIQDNELPPLLNAASADGCRLLPIVVGPSIVGEVESLASLQLVNPPAEPLIGMNLREQENLFVRVARILLGGEKL